MSPALTDHDPAARDPDHDMSYKGHKREQIMIFNAIDYPLQADFVADSEGAHLPASKTAKHCFIKLSGLKVDDEIVSYRLLGRVTSGGNVVTVDADLQKVPKAGTPADPTGDGSNDITQVSETSATVMDEEAVLTVPHVILADTTYNIDVNATTAAGCTAKIHGAEVTINRK